MSKYGFPAANEKNTYLDRPTSHGGWPVGHPGGYTDNKTPVYKQIKNYLEAMGLMSKPDKEDKESNLKEIRALVRELLIFEVLREN